MAFGIQKRSIQKRSNESSSRSSAHFIPEQNFPAFVRNLIREMRVIGPVSRKGHFVFSELDDASELRLDYDVTRLPPKKAIFPPKQPLIRFDGNSFKAALSPVPTALIGVHPYDLRAIEMLDLAFTEGIPDENYLANRRSTLLIGSNVQHHGKRSFYGSVMKTSELKGHDAFLTRITGGYLLETFTVAGRKLASQGAFEKATPAQIDEARLVNEMAETSCPEKLQMDAREIASRVRPRFSDERLWAGLSEKCFSCGSCVIVCPTCYCFDVQDEWNIDQTSGTRSRTWDGCMLKDFAQVSLGGGGATENFRERKSQRYRHRIMRKFAYQAEKFGGAACVGCGRCSTSCVPDIASPVEAVHRILTGEAK